MPKHLRIYRFQYLIRADLLLEEAIIKYSDFEQINREIEDADSKYKNPRNLCSGSVRQLNSQVTAERNVNFVAFALINADDVDFGNSIEQQYKWMESQGFQVVEYRVVTRNSMEDAVKYFAEKFRLTIILLTDWFLCLMILNMVCHLELQPSFHETELLLNGKMNRQKLRLNILNGVQVEQDLLIL